MFTHALLHWILRYFHDVQCGPVNNSPPGVVEAARGGNLDSVKKEGAIDGVNAIDCVSWMFTYSIVLIVLL